MAVTQGARIHRDLEVETKHRQTDSETHLDTAGSWSRQPSALTLLSQDNIVMGESLWF